MRLVRALTAPKEGNSEAQYEDAYALSDGAVAVCDGASAAIYARQWAGLLAESFARAPLPETDAILWERVAFLGEAWRNEVGGGGGAKSWWAEEKLPQGSAASLLILEWDDSRWSALSIGDVCCFVVAENRLRTAFPLTKSRLFNDRPGLVTTTPPADKLRPKVVRYDEAIVAGSRIFVGTDAISHWFLTQFEKKRRPWEQLPEPDAFSAWVAEQRERGGLNNDDTTLLEFAA